MLVIISFANLASKIGKCFTLVNTLGKRAQMEILLARLAMEHYQFSRPLDAF